MRYSLKLYGLIVFVDMVKVTPFELIYGQEVVLLVEINLGAYRPAKQNNLYVDTYYALMMKNIDEVADK
jgi:hypothetical protein